MTETSYTAWDDKLYEWPPPDGWYRASDGKWWPEGYGPGPDGTVAATTEVDAATDGASGDAAAAQVDNGVATGGGHDAGHRADQVGHEPLLGLGDRQDPLNHNGASTGFDAPAGEAAATDASTAEPFGGDRFSGALEDASGAAADAATGLGASAPFGGFESATDAAADVAESFEARDPFGAADSARSVLGSTEDIGSDRPDGLPAADETMVAGSDLLSGLSAATSELPQGLAGLATDGDTRSDEPAPGADDAAPVADGAPDVADPGSPGSTPEPEFFFGGEREGAITDLDSLPPPMVADPGADAGAQADAGAGPLGLGGDAAIADRGFTAPEVDADPSFQPPSGLDDGTGDQLDGRATESFVPEGLDPGAGAGPLAEQPAGSMDWGQQPPPDETMIAPPASGADQPGDGFPAPAATGQLFTSPPAEGTAWGGAAPPGQPAPGGPTATPFEAPPGPDWGQQQPYGQAEGSPQFPTGFDQASLPAGGSTGFSRKVMLAALGVLLLVAVGAVLYVLLRGGDDDAGGGTGEGSFATPHARATGVEISYGAGDADRQWVVEVLEPVRDASADGASAPEAGEVFAATRLRVRNEAADRSAPLGELRFNAVTGDGDVVDRETDGCSVGDDLDVGAALPPSGAIEGTVCWQVPDGALTGLLLGIESTEVGGRVHIRLQ